MTDPSEILQCFRTDRGLRLVGDIDSSTVGALADRLDPLPEGDGDIVVDLAGVQFIDSSGLRTLIGAHRRAEEAGRRLVLSSPSRPVDRLLDIAGVRDLLHVAR